MKYTKKIKREKGKSEQETMFEFDSNAIILITILLTIFMLQVFGLDKFIMTYMEQLPNLL